MASSTDLQQEFEALSKKYHEIEAVNRELSDKLTELYILYNISHILSTTFNINQILKSIFQLFKNSLHVDSAQLFLLEPLRKELQLNEKYGFSKLKSGKILIPDTKLVERIILTQNPLVMSDVTFTGLNDHLKGQNPYFTLAGFPLLTGEKQIIGTLSFFRSTNQNFMRSEFDFLKRISEEVATCIDRALLFRRTHESTILDELTGIYNRRHFNQTFQTEIKRAERYKRNLSILMIDIDDFKTINDTFGHLKGDEILRAITEIMKENLRKADILSRYGGEEFVVLLPETPLNNGVRVGNKLRKKVQKNFKTTNYQIDHHDVTISIGISNFPLDGYSPNKLLETADQRLYRAKSLGKNKTIALEETFEKA